MARRRPKGTGSIFQRGRIWFIQYVDNGGERQRESSHSEDKEAAQRLLNKRLGEIATGEDRDIAVQVTINDLINLVVDDYRFRKLRSLDEVVWKADKNVRPAIGKNLAFRFGEPDVKRYVEDRRQAGALDATINRELAIIRRGFTLGFRAQKRLVVRPLYVPCSRKTTCGKVFLSLNSMESC